MKPLFTVVLIVISTCGYAQFPKTSPTSNRVEAMANNLTDSYNKELVLTGVQIPLFKDVIEEYIVKAEEVIEKLRGREQLNALVELQARESLEMNDILTQIQYRRYQKVKPYIQPLKMVGG